MLEAKKQRKNTKKTKLQTVSRDALENLGEKSYKTMSKSYENNIKSYKNNMKPYKIHIESNENHLKIK